MNNEIVIKGWVARDDTGEIFIMQLNKRRYLSADETIYKCYVLPEEVFPEMKYEDDPIEAEMIIKRVDK